MSHALRSPAKLFVSFQQLFLASLLFYGAQAAAAEYRVNQTDHPLDAYAVGALKVALANMEGNHKVAVSTEQITQARAVENLEAGEMDVMWLASNREMEDRLRPIRFPILKGLLGHRVFIINPQKQGEFARVQSFDDLRNLSFGQGKGWPDVEILESNGLNVITTSKYNNLFYMVEGGRFDGFPRGVLEPWVELASRRDLGLTVESHVVLIYTLPFYLYVARDNIALANKIHEGLDRALQNGSFDTYFYGSDMVKDALSRSQLKNRVAFKISNPSLHPKTPVNREEYWLDLQKL